ncbi:MAG: transposase, partial [Proteobacteria bacterium]|nr:transposase [Pseudomonadota bacterium]
HARERKHIGRGGIDKEIAFAIVERGGSVRSHQVPKVNAKTLRPILTAQIDRKSTLMTDDAGQYRYMHRDFARHEVVNHGIEEYVRGDAHTNTVESYFAILKRGIAGDLSSRVSAALEAVSGRVRFPLQRTSQA